MPNLDVAAYSYLLRKLPRGKNWLAYSYLREKLACQ